MSRLVLGATCITLLLSSTANARQTGLEARARRLVKYFKNAHRAVDSGGVAPYARVTNVGGQARLFFGLQAGVSRAEVVIRGRVQRRTALYGGGTCGIQAGLGPELSRMTYVGTRGMKAEDLLPAREGSFHQAIGAGMRASESKGSLGLGWSLGTYTGLGLGRVWRRLVHRGRPHKTPMLRHLEEGLRLSGEVERALGTGWSRGLAAKVKRLGYLHGQVASEKRMLNAELRPIQQLLDLQRRAAR
jgi:hypothetical protein